MNDQIVSDVAYSLLTDDLEDGRSFRKYSISSFRKDPLEQARPEVRGIVNRIYQKWAAIDLNLLFDHVYFETAPMLTAQRSGSLDFSQISSAAEPTAEPARDFDDHSTGETAGYPLSNQAAAKRSGSPARSVASELGGKWLRGP